MSIEKTTKLAKKQDQDYDGSTPLKSVQQEMFVSNLLSGMSQAQAYRKAGYKAKNPDSQANQIMRNKKVALRVAYKRDILQKKLDITPERNLRAMANIAYADLAEFYDEDGNLKNIHEIPKAARMAIAGIDVEEIFEGRGKNRKKVGEIKKVRRWDPNKAQENIAKILGQFSDEVDKGKEPVQHVVINFNDIKIAHISSDGDSANNSAQRQVHA